MGMYERLRSLKEKGEYSQLAYFLEEHLLEISNTPCTLALYNLIKDVYIETTLGKMIVAWLAFLNGDNQHAYNQLKNFEEENIQDVRLKAFYNSLQALMLFRDEPKKKLQLAEQAVEALPKNDRSIFMANAKLTYGQMLAGFLRYREAAVFFQQAYQLFDDLNLDFLASLAMTNKLLNLYYLGELKEVVKESNEKMIRIGDLQNRDKGPWNMLYLPLGMSCFQIGKLNLACKYLNLAKNYIENTQLLHMQGVVEPFLMKTYYLLGKKTQVKQTMDDILKKLGHMHYIYTPLLKSLYYGLLEDDQEIECVELGSFIEGLEIEFNKSHYQGNYLAVEVLLLLQQKGLTDCITLEYIVEMIQVTRFTGMRTQLQEFLIFLAERNESENREAETINCLKEALEIKRNTGIVVNFYLYMKKTVYRLRELDLELYKQVLKWQATENKNQESILTSKEKEILTLVAEGKSNLEISQQLYITVGTVKWHMNHILSKLGVKNRTQAIVEAKRLGEIT